MGMSWTFKTKSGQTFERSTSSPFPRFMGHQEAVGGLNIQFDKTQTGRLYENLNAVSGYVSFEAAMSLVKIAADFFQHAQPLVPYETGQLRDSARATLFIGYAGGFGSYGVDVVTAQKPQVTRTPVGEDAFGPIYSYTTNTSMDVHGSKINAGRFIKTVRGQSVNKLDLFLHYTRINEGGENIALWVHEEILPFSSRPKTRKERQESGESFATKPGTMPKYMEIPWLARESEYVTRISDGVAAGIRSAKRQFKTIRKGKNYTVDEIAL